jgi:hypothetical protein
MNGSLLVGEIEVQAGQPAELPPTMRAVLTPGRWRIQCSRVSEGEAARAHDAFLNSYAESDEGLYDDVARG